MKKEIIHLLGYLKAEHWADAIRYDELDKNEIYNLMREVEETYDIDIHSEVEEILKRR